MKKPGKHGSRLIVRNLCFSSQSPIYDNFLRRSGSWGTFNSSEKAKNRNKGFVFFEFEKISTRSIQGLLDFKAFQGAEWNDLKVLVAYF